MNWKPKEKCKCKDSKRSRSQPTNQPPSVKFGIMHLDPTSILMEPCTHVTNIKETHLKLRKFDLFRNLRWLMKTTRKSPLWMERRRRVFRFSSCRFGETVDNPPPSGLPPQLSGWLVILGSALACVAGTGEPPRRANNWGYKAQAST